MASGIDAVTEVLSDFIDTITGQKSKRQRERVWRSFAAQHRGEYVPGQYGFLQSRPASVHMVVRDVAVLIDTYVVRSNNSSTTYTRFRAPYLMPWGPTFRVYREHALSSFGKMLGFQDVVLGGDPAFDGRFVVKTSTAVATRRAFVPAVKQALVRGGGSVQADGRNVKYTLTGAVSAAAILEQGTHIVTELARYGMDWFTALSTLPGAQWVHPSGSWSARTPPTVQLTDTGPEVWIYPVADKTMMSVCVAARLRRQLPRFHIELTPDGPTHEPPDGLLDPEALPLLRPVGRGSLGHDDKWLRLVLAGRIDNERVLAAARLVRKVSSASLSVGAFR